MPIFHYFRNNKSLKINYQANLQQSVDKYTIKYTSGIQDFYTNYKVTYTSVMPSEIVLGFTAINTYEYDDKVLEYRVYYTSGVEILDRVDRYRVRYVSDNPTSYKVPYRVLYNSEVVPTDISTLFKVSYTSEFLSNTVNTYTIRYNSVGIESVENRTRWSVKYTSQSLGDYSTQYKIKYTTSIFYDNSSMYVVKYTSEGAEEVLTRVALLKKEDDSMDALFEIKGSFDKQMDSYLYVFSNLPKYQLLEFKIGDVLPYIIDIPSYELAGKDIFPTEISTQYSVKGYLLVKNIDPTNPISLDLYNYETSEKINKSKSYLFDLNNVSFEDKLTTIIGTEYKKKNLKANGYEYGNLNFVFTEVTPIFSPGDSCCFSRKILPPGSPNISGACSPF